MLDLCDPPYVLPLHAMKILDNQDTKPPVAVLSLTWKENILLSL